MMGERREAREKERKREIKKGREIIMLIRANISWQNRGRGRRGRFNGN